MTNAQIGMKFEAYRGNCIGLLIKEIAKKYDLDPVDIQDIVNDMESDGIRVTREDIEDMYLNGDLF